MIIALRELIELLSTFLDNNSAPSALDVAASAHPNILCLLGLARIAQHRRHLAANRGLNRYHDVPDLPKSPPHPRQLVGHGLSQPKLMSLAMLLVCQARSQTHRRRHRG